MDDQKNNEVVRVSDVEKIPTVDMGMMAELHKRLADLEAKTAELHDALNAARNSGAVPYPGFIEHIAHVMQKYHAADKPEGFDEKYPVHGDNERG